MNTIGPSQYEAAHKVETCFRQVVGHVMQNNINKGIIDWNDGLQSVVNVEGGGIPAHSRSVLRQS